MPAKAKDINTSSQKQRKRRPHSESCELCLHHGQCKAQPEALPHLRNSATQSLKGREMM